MTTTVERSEAPPPPKRKRRRSRWRSMIFVALLVSVGLIAAGVLPVQQYLERETQVREAQDRLDQLLASNESLSEDAAALLTEQEIERIAREQYGFVRPGEIGYIVITPEPDPESTAEPVVPEATSDDRSLLQRIWDFIAGHDATVDG